MRTPEFVPDQAREGRGSVRRIARGLPLVSRVYLTLMTALLAAADHQPAYSQIDKNSPHSSNGVEATILKDVIPEIPPNPKYINVNTGEKGKLYTRYGTGPIFPNTKLNTTTDFSLIIGSNDIIQAYIQGNEKLFPPDTDNISTLAKEYNAKSDLFYLLETYGKPGQDPFLAPLVILSVPRLKATDYSAQERMPVSLPALVVPDYISSFNMSNDGDSLQIAIKNELDPIKKTSVDIGINEKGRANGIVQIKQFLRRLWLSVLLDQSK